MATLTGYKATKEPVYSLTVLRFSEKELMDKISIAIDTQSSFENEGFENVIIPYGVLNSLVWVITDESE